MRSLDFGRVADIYDATRSLPEGEMKLLIGALASAIPGSGPVVDVGVGTGRFAKPLQDRGFEVVGIDISRGMVAKAKGKGVSQLVFADVHRTPFRDGVFEAALLVHVLHLVSDWVAVVRESARISRGSLISVIEVGEGSGRDVMREEYRKTRAEMGYPIGRFVEGELGLRKRMPPDRVIPVFDGEREAEADEEIRHLQERGQSLTWEVPEEAHMRIIGKLRAEFGGTKLRSKSKIELAVWSAPPLRQAMFAESKGPAKTSFPGA